MSFDFGVGRPLAPDEIHAIAAIDAEAGAPVAEIGKALDKTTEEAKTLADQLCEYGLIIRDGEPDHVRLSEQGLRAQENHLGFHIERDKHFLAYIASLDEEAFATFCETCREMEKWMDSYFR